MLNLWEFMTTSLISDLPFELSATVAQDLAGAYGTPLYVIDEAHLRARIRRYRNAFAACYPQTELTFASKANSTLAVLKIAASEGCMIDAASEGELRAAIEAGVPAGRCHLHGNNKSRQELVAAIQLGVHQIVIDNFAEIELIHALKQEMGTCPDLVMRLAPGVDPITHAKISTGQADTKFGFNITDGSAEKGTVRCLELKLPLVGYHCHVGSQLLDPEAQRSGGALIAGFAKQMLQSHGFASQVINVGGGLGVRYTENDQPMPVEQYSQLVVDSVMAELDGTDLKPTLVQEPGRSIIAESGVTLYTVGVRKTVPKSGGTRTYLCVDGGLSDNPRPVMYGSKYTVKAFHGSAETATFTISGKHCETDKLFEDVMLPAEVKEGDLLQVLCTGAYNSAMASNYNRFPRPATALLRANGDHCLVQRRETWQEMFARESVPGDLA